jgi:hypothetical protein
MCLFSQTENNIHPPMKREIRNSVRVDNVITVYIGGKVA